MTIAEMHIMFRQMAQQMGMQNVRGILPEQIDMLINTSITDVVNEIIKQNISATNDRVATDNSKIGQINALSTLYKTSTISISASGTKQTLMTQYIDGIDISSSIEDYMFLVDFAINYTVTVNATGVLSDYFPVRLIDDMYLADVLNDFILAPSFRSPVSVIKNVDGNKVMDLYLERKRNGKFMVGVNLTPCDLRVSYVATPAKVQYLEDVASSDKNVDCDLPEYLHGDIVKRAVDLYNASLSGSLMSAQAQQRRAQQEAMRNNYRQGDDSQQQ